MEKIIEREIEDCKKVYYYYMKLYDKYQREKNSKGMKNAKKSFLQWKIRMEEAEYILQLIKTQN